MTSYLRCKIENGRRKNGSKILFSNDNDNAFKRLYTVHSVRHKQRGVLSGWMDGQTEGRSIDRLSHRRASISLNVKRVFFLDMLKIRLSGSGTKVLIVIGGLLHCNGQ